jgi:hypothetical protein
LAEEGAAILLVGTLTSRKINKNKISTAANQIVTCRTMAGYDMPADDTALLDLLLERTKAF